MKVSDPAIQLRAISRSAQRNARGAPISCGRRRNAFASKASALSDVS
jgi:hypothetical protein